MTKITNSSRTISFINAVFADSFFLRLKGLMFKKSISRDEGIILVGNRESIMDSSIHMLFMNFDICVLWVDKDYKVCDKRIAKKWRLAYFPKQPAKYVIELSEHRFNDFIIGDQLIFQNE